MPVVLAHARLKSEEYVVPRRTTYREDSANKKALRSFLFVSAPFLRVLCLHRIILAFEGIRDSAGIKKESKKESLCAGFPIIIVVVIVEPTGLSYMLLKHVVAYLSEINRT